MPCCLLSLAVMRPALAACRFAGHGPPPGPRSRPRDRRAGPGGSRRCRPRCAAPAGTRPRPGAAGTGKICPGGAVLMRRGKRCERGGGPVAVALDEVIRKLLDGKNFASVATLNPDGGPQASVVWILRDGDTV